MSLLLLVRRLAVFVLAGALPCAAVGYSLGHVRGLLIAEAAFVLFVFLAAFRAEKAILKTYRVRSETPEGVGRSLDRVLSLLGGPEPRVFSFSDPAPQALVVRSPGGPGSILLSEGLLGALTEEELRSLLRAGVLRLRARGACFQSLCAWLAQLSLELAPKAWVELLFGELRWHEDLGAVGAVRFLMVYSLSKFFVGLGRAASIDAPHALVRLPSVAGEVSNPGSCILHFSDPWADRSLLRL